MSTPVGEAARTRAREWRQRSACSSTSLIELRGGRARGAELEDGHTSNSYQFEDPMIAGRINDGGVRKLVVQWWHY
jgi:hypothetical protein